MTDIEKEPDEPSEDETVAITGSPNTVNEIAFDVMESHLQTPLLGTLVELLIPKRGKQGIEKLLTLAQVTRIQTTNPWHEDRSLKNYIKVRGNIPHLTRDADITGGVLQVLGAYRKTDDAGKAVYKKLRLPIPPGSGIPIHLVNANLIHSLMSQDNGYGYLGYFWGSNNVPAPAYVRHFGDYTQQGSGEAYMGAAFGPSGCGKSIIAAMLIALWSHHPQMGILIIDPASEFSRNAFALGSQYDFNFFDILTKFSHNRFTQRNIITLDRLQLEGTQLFTSVLEQKRFFHTLGIGDSKIGEASQNANKFLEDLRTNGLWDCQMDWATSNAIQMPPDSAHAEFPKSFVSEMARAYAASSRHGKIHDFHDSWQNSGKHLQQIWDDTVQYFLPTTRAGQPRANLNDIVQDVMENGSICILDINPEAHQMGDAFKTTLMDFVFKRLRRRSHMLYASRRPANCLIVIDEAGRFIPQDPGDNENLRNLTRTLTDSVRELRKNRCGFFFITQTIAEIQKDIYRNLHYRIYGVGLGVGVDAEHIRNREGNDAYELYRSLPDPHLSSTFSFMIAGVLLALGSSGNPMVIEGFPGGNTLLLENRHIIQRPDEFTDLGDTATE